MADKTLSLLTFNILYYEIDLVQVLVVSDVCINISLPYTSPFAYNTKFFVFFVKLLIWKRVTR